MPVRIATQRDVVSYSLLITGLSVVVPVTLVSILLYDVPTGIKWPYLALSAGIPFFIALPISLLALGLVKTINETVETVNNLVRFDPLTGVLCRSYFCQRWRETRSDGGYFALVDVDFFKSVNDTYGHEAGDEALKFIANAMTQTIGSFGIVGRFGGEEFCIFMPKLGRDQAKLLLAQLGTRLRSEPYDFATGSRFLTASIGMAADSPSEPVGTTIRLSDRCLYAAKARGRDRCVMEIELDEMSNAA